MSNLAADSLQAAAEEIQATFTERVATAREEIILAHHETGKIIHGLVAEGHKATALMQYFNSNTKVGDRTLWDSYDFFEKFPNYEDISKLGHGKNISWNKIKRALKGKVEKEEIDLPPCNHTCLHHCK